MLPPPKDNPCKVRNNTNKIGDSTPIESKSGKNAIPPTEIISKLTDIKRETLLPYLSPIYPNNNDPKGLTKKAIANIINDNIKDKVSLI